MLSEINLNVTSIVLLAVYILVSTLGAVASIMHEFLGHSGWGAVAYVITTAIFMVISINIFLLVQSARMPAKQ